jgi:preprotein translocase subunit YajC
MYHHIIHFCIRIAILILMIVIMIVIMIAVVYARQRERDCAEYTDEIIHGYLHY